MRVGRAALPSRAVDGSTRAFGAAQGEVIGQLLSAREIEAWPRCWTGPRGGGCTAQHERAAGGRWLRRWGHDSRAQPRGRRVSSPGPVPCPACGPGLRARVFVVVVAAADRRAEPSRVAVNLGPGRLCCSVPALSANAATLSPSTTCAHCRNPTPARWHGFLPPAPSPAHPSYLAASSHPARLVQRTAPRPRPRLAADGSTQQASVRAPAARVARPPRSPIAQLRATTLDGSSQVVPCSACTSIPSYISACIRSFLASTAHDSPSARSRLESHRPRLPLTRINEAAYSAGSPKLCAGLSRPIRWQSTSQRALSGSEGPAAGRINMSATPPKKSDVEPGAQSPDESSEPHMDREAQDTQAQGLGYEFEVKEQDRWLPIANGTSEMHLSPHLICAPQTRCCTSTNALSTPTPRISV